MSEKPKVATWEELSSTEFHRPEKAHQPRSIFQDISDQLNRLSKNIGLSRAEATEEQILLFFKPRPWWMPGPVQRWLLRELTTTIITSYVPLASPPVTLSPLSMSTRNDFFDSLRNAYLRPDLPPPVAQPDVSTSSATDPEASYVIGPARADLMMTIHRGWGF